MSTNNTTPDTPHPTMKQFYCWNDQDPNDSITVEAEDELRACYALLAQLGWCVGEGEEIDETETETQDPA